MKPSQSLKARPRNLNPARRYGRLACGSGRQASRHWKICRPATVPRPESLEANQRTWESSLRRGRGEGEKEGEETSKGVWETK